MTISLYIIFYLCIAHVVFLYNIIKIRGNAYLSMEYSTKDNYLQSLLWILKLITATSMSAFILLYMLFDKCIVSPAIWMYDWWKTLGQDVLAVDPRDILK